MALVYERIVKQDFDLGWGTRAITMPDGGKSTGDKVGIHTFLGTTLNVLDFGAVGDGETDDRAAIQAAVDALTSDGGVVFIPAGTYLISEAVTLSSKVALVGVGRQSVFKLANASDDHMVTMKDTTDHYIAHLRFEGQSAGQTVGVHAIRGEGVSRVYIHDVYIDDTYGYGIGFQAGTMTDIEIDHAVISNTGSDGIDFKNPNANNSGIRLSNITVKSPGRIASGQAGIDIRGQGTVLTNIVVTGLDATMGGSAAGVRFRSGTGLGQYSSINGFYIEGSGVSTANGVISAAPGVSIANGTVTGCTIGAAVTGSADHCMFSNVHVYQNLTRGFSIDVGCNYTSIVNCQAVDNTGDGIRLTDATHCRIVNSTFFDTGAAVQTVGIREVTAAANHTYIGNYLAGNTAAQMVILDTTGIHMHNRGWITESEGTATVTSGNTFTSVNHGLSVTPAAGAIQVTPTNNLGSAAKFWVDTIGASQFRINTDVDPGAGTATFAWKCLAWPTAN